MAFAPIAYTAPQYEEFANFFIKAFEQATTTPKVMATDATGDVTVAKFQLDSRGFIITAGAVIVIPFIDGAYDLFLFPTEAEADANDTANAIQVADNIIGVVGSAVGSIATQELTTATMAANTNKTYSAGDLIDVEEFSTDNDGAGRWKAVVTGTTPNVDLPNLFSIIVGTDDPLVSFVYQYEDVIDVDAIGGTQAAINHGESILLANQTLRHNVGPYTLSGDRAVRYFTSGATYEFRGTQFSYGTNIDRAVVFGQGAGGGSTIFDMTAKGTLKVTRSFDSTGTVPAATTLVGTGILYLNVGDMNTQAFYATASGFKFGHRYASENGGITTSTFGKTVEINCLVGFDFNVGAGANDFTTSLDCYGFKSVYNRAFFSDHVGTIGVRFDGVTRRCDNVRLFGGTIEARKERKFVFDNCEGCDVIENYYDPGGFSSAGGVDFLKVLITGASVTSGSNILTATAHGIPAKIGDKIIPTSSASVQNNRHYTVIGFDANSFTLNRKFITTSTGDVDFTYYGAQIEFTSKARQNSIINGAVLEQNVITEVVSDRNMIIGQKVGMQRGTAEPRPMDILDPENIEGLGLWIGGATNKIIYTYTGNSAVQLIASAGHCILTTGTNGVLLPSAALVAVPESKNDDGVKSGCGLQVAHNTGGFHTAFNVTSDGVQQIFGGPNGTDRGKHQTFTFQGNKADLGQIDLPLGGRGIVTVSANAEGGIWIVQDDGTVTKIAGTTNTADVDGAGVLTVFKTGSITRVRNRLGVAADMIVTYHFGI